jgi:crotonobetainyl-CoA:carnitine CoA-transferase CaiB-like acyl-CoA transferase
MTMLSTLKILDFSTLLPGPYATMLLADLGADVIHIEAPNRPDLMRQTPPFDGGQSAWHSLLNRNKRSLALDLKQPQAVALVKRLVQRYDIVLEQFRPGVMERLGVGYEALRVVKPDLIYCAITAYGQTGPYRDRAAHDINLMALSGIMSHTGRRSEGPPPLGIQVADLGSSYNAITGILAAVIHRLTTGEGQYVDISMMDTALAWNALAATHYLVGGAEPEREGWLLNGGGGYDFYRTADERYLAVGSLEPKFWQGFLQAIGNTQYEIRETEHSDQWTKEAIRAAIATRTLAEWMALFAQLDLCVEPVLSVGEALAHPQTQARQMIVPVPKPDGTPQLQTANPIKFSSGQPHYRHTGTALGAHTLSILHEIGYTDSQVRDLQQANVFGAVDVGSQALD